MSQEELGSHPLERHTRSPAALEPRSTDGRELAVDNSNKKTPNQSMFRPSLTSGSSEKPLSFALHSALTVFQKILFHVPEVFRPAVCAQVMPSLLILRTQTNLRNLDAKEGPRIHSVRMSHSLQKHDFQFYWRFMSRKRAGLQPHLIERLTINSGPIKKREKRQRRQSCVLLTAIC